MEGAPEGWGAGEANRLRSVFEYVEGGQPTFDPYQNFYDPNDEDDYEPEVYAAPQAPAKLSDIPTSSTNVSRPRTVAAGYDAARKTMTVVFRDGTVYNYYDVSPGEWEGFHDSVSKGRPWLNKYGPGTPGLFIQKDQGPADMSNIDPQIAQDIYRIARTAQVRYSTKTRRVTTNSAGTGFNYNKAVSKSAQRKLSTRGAASRALGKNTATANKPHKPHRT